MTVKRRRSNVAKKKKVLQALQTHLGVVTKACQDAEINRKTYYEWLKVDPQFKKDVEEIRYVTNEEILDFAESALFKQIRDGNITAIWNLLKSKGKDRGYQEQSTINIKPLEVKYILPEGIKEQDQLPENDQKLLENE
jgi:hypothetical protein